MAVILLFVSCLALIPNGEANILLVDMMHANVGDQMSIVFSLVHYSSTGSSGTSLSTGEP